MTTSNATIGFNQHGWIRVTRTLARLEPRPAEQTLPDLSRGIERTARPRYGRVRPTESHPGELSLAHRLGRLRTRFVRLRIREGIPS